MDIGTPFLPKENTNISLFSAADQELPGRDTNDGGPMAMASENALDFLRRIRLYDFDGLLFNDNLTSVPLKTKNDTVELRLVVERAKFDEKDCIAVNANSEGKIDGIPCGTSIRALISYELVTLEQEHHEYMKLEHQPIDRRTCISTKDNCVFVNQINKNGGNEARASKVFNCDEVPGFISEGANILLQRLMMKKGFDEPFWLPCIDANANLCVASYKELEYRTIDVGSSIAETTGISRTLEAHDDVPVTWLSYFMSDSHLVMRVQVGSPFCMTITSLPPRVDKDEFLPKSIFEKKPLAWEDDMQMQSVFEDKKEEKENDCRVYMDKHLEVRAIMADFLQFVLLRKPEDVFECAAEYFGPLSAKQSCEHITSTCME